MSPEPMKKMQLLTILLLVGSATQAQVLSPEAYRTIRASASGQRALGDFWNLTQFSGFAPSAGADQIANYLLLETSRLGLANANIERFPSDGKTYVWAFRTEPYWEAHRAELWLEKPHSGALGCLGFSPAASKEIAGGGNSLRCARRFLAGILVSPPFSCTRTPTTAMQAVGIT